MNRETFKTVMLSLLIIISLIFTWNIWTFQPKLGDIEEESQTQVRTKQTLSHHTRKLSQVIKPMEMFIHENGAHYGMTDRKLFNTLWSDMCNWDFKSAKDISDQFDEQSFKNWFYGENRKTAKLELVFSDTIPIDVFQTLFNWPDKSYEYNSFDRIVIPFTNQKDSKRIYFVSYSKKSVLEVNLQSANYRNVMSSIYKKKASMPSYTFFTLGAKKELLLPKSPLQLKEKKLLTDNISTNLFKQVLFNEPQLVRQESNLSRNIFTDGTNRLDVNTIQRQIQFQHRNISPNTSYRTGDLIKKTFKYLNDTGSWTDNYQYFNMNDNQQINFIMMMDGLPIINSRVSPFGLSNITIQWADDDVLSYKHPNYVLGNNTLKAQQKALMSGSELIQLLKTQKIYNVNDIDQVFLGYQMISLSADQDPIVKLQPVWCIKINGKIQPVTKDLLREGKQIGVE